MHALGDVQRLRKKALAGTMVESPRGGKGLPLSVSAFYPHKKIIEIQRFFVVQYSPNIMDFTQEHQRC